MLGMLGMFGYVKTLNWMPMAPGKEASQRQILSIQLTASHYTNAIGIETKMATVCGLNAI